MGWRDGRRASREWGKESRMRNYGDRKRNGKVG